MRLRAFILLGLAVLFAAVSVVLARAWLERQGATAMASPNVELVPVVVAAAPLSYGSIVTPEALRLVAWPKAGAPEHTFSTIAAVAKPDDEGPPRVVLQDMAAGEPVLPSKVSGAAGAANLASRIAVGKRAVTIPVNGTRGVGGFVRANDRVDVLLTHHRGPGAKTDRPPVDVLLLDAKVLAADRTEGPTGARGTATRTVTLEVSPEEAQKLALAETLGLLSLALRHVPFGADRDPGTAARGVTLEDLMATIAAAGRKAPAPSITASATAPATTSAPAVRAPSPTGSAVRVFRGLEASDYTVEREMRARPQKAARP